MANVTPDDNDPRAQDRAYDPESLRAREQANLQSAEQNNDRSFQDNQASSTGSDIASQEANPNTPPDIKNSYTGKKQKSKLVLKQGAKKYGPVGGVLITLLGGGIGVAGLLSPSFILMQIKETLLDFSDNATPAMSIKTKMLLRMKVGVIKNGFQFSDNDGTCGIRCKFGTMDNKLVKSFVAKGWEVTEADGGSRIPTRTVVASMKAPDGTVLSSAADFDAYTKSTKGLLELNKVINFRSAFYLNSAFKALYDRLGLGKKAVVTGESEEEIGKSIKEAEGLLEGEGGSQGATGGDSSEEAANQQANDSLGPERASGLKAKFATKISKSADLAGAVCGLYDLGRGMSLAVKAAKISLYISTAWMVLNLTDEIASGDNPSPQAVDAVTSQVTSYDNNAKNSDGTDNAFFGQSFTDSKAYKMAAYNDNPGTLSPQEQKFAITSASVGGWIGSILALMGQPGSAQASAMKGVCSVYGQAGLTAGSCAAEIAGESVVPVAGTAAGIATCIISNVGGGIVIGGVLGLGIGEVFKLVAASELPDNISEAHGGEMGTATSLGVMSLENQRGANLGLITASSQEDISSYKVAVSSETDQMTKVARVEAQSTPFDITNQYSFLGTLARSIGIQQFANASGSSTLGSILSIIPRSFSTIISPVGAAESEASSYASLFATCSDSGMSSVGVPCTSFDVGSDIMTPQALGLDVDPTLDYMESHNQINKDGSPVDKSDYSKYVTYCRDRTTPMGEAEIGVTGDITSPDAWTDPGLYDWAIGTNCTTKGNPNPEELSYFSAYTAYYQSEDTVSNLYSNSSGSSDSTETNDSNAGADSPASDVQSQQGYLQTPSKTVALSSLLPKQPPVRSKIYEIGGVTA